MTVPIEIVAVIFTAAFTGLAAQLALTLRLLRDVAAIKACCRLCIDREN